MGASGRSWGSSQGPPDDACFVSTVLPSPLGVLTGTSRPPTPTLSLKPAPPAPVRLSPAPPPGSSSLLKPLTVPPGYTFPSGAATTASATTATAPSTAVPAPAPAPQRLILSPDMQARLPCKWPGLCEGGHLRWEQGFCPGIWGRKAREHESRQSGWLTHVSCSARHE